MNGFPSIAGWDTWIDVGRTTGGAVELMVSAPMQVRPFWLKFTDADGKTLGWVRFEHMVNLRNQATYSAVEVRSAREQAPPPQDVLLRLSASPSRVEAA